MTRTLATILTAAALGTGFAMAADAPAPPKLAPPVAGDYKFDLAHTTLLFKVSHLGFSNFTARFTKYDAKLHFDPAKPESSTLEVMVDPSSLTLDNPPKRFVDTLKGPQWLDVAKYPKMTFVSKSIKVTGQNTGEVTGDFTLHGVTKPVTLDVTFNGGWAGLPGMDPHARAGFSAHGTLKRSDFGVSLGIPSPATGGMGVSDEVQIIIETEFEGPALKP